MIDYPRDDELDDQDRLTDAWAARFLDGPANEAATSDTARADQPQESAGEQDSNEVDARRAADLGFLHSLLEEVHAVWPADVERRVDRVMAAIAETPLTTAPATLPFTPEVSPNSAPRLTGESHVARRPWVFSSLSAAAALVALLAWYWTGPHGQVAAAALRRVSLDAARLADRQYRVTTELSIGDDHISTLESNLWVRGNQKFVLRHPGVLGPVWLGNNGSHGWFVPAVGKPQLDQDPISTQRWARRAGVALPELQVSALIEHLQRSFDLELLPSERLDGQGTIHWQRVRAVRRIPHAERPQVIELWAHPETGVAQRLILDWQRQGGDLGLLRVTLDLTDEEPQSDAWYESETHPASFPILPIQLLLQPAKS